MNTKLDVVRFECEDVIATSTCDADLTKYTYLLRINDVFNDDGDNIANVTFYDYDSDHGIFNIIGSGNDSFESFTMYGINIEDIAVGNWWHCEEDGPAELCKNPKSHTINSNSNND